MIRLSHLDQIKLSLGDVRYRDQGSGAPIVFVHGLLVDGTLWRKVTPLLPEDRFRCVVPDWPLGSHLLPMNEDAELSLLTLARLVTEFLEALDLDDVTLVANDTGGAIAQLAVVGDSDRIARLVLTPCDAFENCLPPLFRPLQYLAHVPPLLTLAVQSLRLRALRRTPLAFGWLAKHPIPSEVTDGWLRPFLSDPLIRRDTAHFLRAIDRRDTLSAAERLPCFERPALLAWASDGRVFPLDHARRLAALLPDARLEEVSDTYGFIPEDQPERLASLIAEFVAPADGDQTEIQSAAN